MSKLTIETAELAMGSSARVMAEYAFKKQLGWLVHFDPDEVIRRAGRTKWVKPLIWC